MKYDIFISYRRNEGSGRSNVPMARTFKLEFERRGYKVFFDYSECTDNYFSQTILPAIRTCDYFVLILTADSLSRCVNEGDWVRREIEEALAYNKKIIPITPDNECSSWSELPEPLKRLDGLQITTIHTDHMFEACVGFLIQNRFHVDGNHVVPEEKVEPRLPVESETEKPQNYMVLSVVSVFLFWIVGFVALINSVRVDKLWNDGQGEKARKASKTAHDVALVAIIIGAIFYVIMIIGIAASS